MKRILFLILCCGTISGCRSIDPRWALTGLVDRKEAEAEAKVKKGVKLKFWDPEALGDRLHYID